MEETKANRFAELEAKKELLEQLTARNNELENELKEFENEAPVL